MRALTRKEFFVDNQRYRQILGHFATGVTIVIAEVAGSWHGMTANSFTSVSLDPPLILLAIDHKARMKDAIQKNRPLTISILRDSQTALSQLFAQVDPLGDPFSGLQVERAQSGVPYLKDALAYVACRITANSSEGDHDLVICRVEELAVLGPGNPLIFFQGRYHRIDRLDSQPS